MVQRGVNNRLYDRKLSNCGHDIIDITGIGVKLGGASSLYAKNFFS